MISYKIVKNKNKKSLDNILNNLKQLDKSKVEAGYFQKQGVHTSFGIPYTAVAQGIELGMFSSFKYVPAPFMKQISHVAIKNMKKSGKFKSNQKLYFSKLKNKNSQLGKYHNAIGQQFLLASTKVFNNPMYFPQLGGNATPLVETGELLQKFAYRSSVTKRIIE